MLMYNSITCNTWGMTKEVETAETSVSISLCMPHGTACFSFVLIIDFTGICVINIPFLLFLTHVHTLIYTTTRESRDLKLIRSPLDFKSKFSLTGITRIFNREYCLDNRFFPSLARFLDFAFS